MNWLVSSHPIRSSVYIQMKSRKVCRAINYDTVGSVAISLVNQQRRIPLDLIKSRKIKRFSFYYISTLRRCHYTVKRILTTPEKNELELLGSDGVGEPLQYHIHPHTILDINIYLMKTNLLSTNNAGAVKEIKVRFYKRKMIIIKL
jgi:hypothetical protein